MGFVLRFESDRRIRVLGGLSADPKLESFFAVPWEKNFCHYCWGFLFSNSETRM